MSLNGLKSDRIFLYDRAQRHNNFIKFYPYPQKIRINKQLDGQIIRPGEGV